MIAASGRHAEPTGGRIVGVYLITTALFTLAASLIWGVNTLFLLDAGLDLFQVMLVNAMFSLGQVIFEVPTGVVADTIGRRACFALGIFTLLVSTLLYLGSAELGWGMVGFLGASVLLGLGYTFQTGAVDAWLVDALDHVSYTRPKSEVFARGGMVAGATMLVGTLLGGVLGQADLAWPYLLRSAILLVTLVVVLALMRDIGFQPRPLRISRFGEETRAILAAGTTYGWRHPVVRPLLFVSLSQGLFFMYFFYSSQPYALALLGRPDLVWVAGALTAMFALSGVVGNSLVGAVTKRSWGRSASRLLAVGAVLNAVLTALLGMIGFFTPEGGSITSFGALAALLALSGIVGGVVAPVRQAFINEHIPSAQRATVLSLDSFFADVGGSVGQPVFGWMSKAFSIPVTYLVGAIALGVSAPLYREAGRHVREGGGSNHVEVTPPQSTESDLPIEPR